MFWTVIAAIFLLGGIITAWVAPKKVRPAGTFAGAGGAVLGVLIFVLAGINSVPVKNVGVVTSFGHVEGDMQPGFHWLLPWKNVTNLSETIQTTEFYGPQPKGNCLDVRIGGQQLACLNLTIQWQIRDSAAPQLFNDYDTSGNVQGQITDAVVIQELKSVVNQVMGDYNPIQDVSATGSAGNSQFSTFGPQILSRMRQDIGSQIDVRKLILSNAYYDGATQSRLNAIQQQYADTAIAQQQIQTNAAQAKANQALAKSISDDPGVLVADCQQITLTAIKDGYQLPAGWNCGTTASMSLAIGATK
jgi:regulator of protease activity HflC (stomatin/prohibitin superfamily)